MARSGWSTRELLLSALLAFICGVFGSALWFKQHEPSPQANIAITKSEAPASIPPTQPATRPPTLVPEQPPPTVLMPEPQKPGELLPKAALTLEEFATKIDAAQKELAFRKCRWLSQAVEAYRTSARNKQMVLPESLLDLRKPPFGGTPFVPEDALFDPWSRPNIFEIRLDQRKRLYVYVFTMAPDGTPISNFGIDKESYPPL